MRKFIINFLLSTLSKKQKKQILKELKKAIKLVSRKRGKRGPYKKRAKIEPIVHKPIPPVDLPIVVERDDTKRGYYCTERLKKMDIGDIAWFKRPRQNISPLVSLYATKTRKTFQCSAIGKNSTEVKRLA